MAYLEAMKVFWLERFNPDGGEFSSLQNGYARRIVHILASVEEVFSFGDVGLLTPYHRKQIENMSLRQKLDLLVEAKKGRDFQHKIVGIYLGAQSRKKIEDYERFFQMEIMKSILGAEKVKSIEDFLVMTGFQGNKSFLKHIMAVFIDVLHKTDIVPDSIDPMGGLMILRDSPNGKTFDREISILLIDLLGVDALGRDSSKIIDKINVWFSQAKNMSKETGGIQKIEKPLTLFEESI